MKANSEKTKQSKKATRRVLAGVLCGASVLSLVLSLVMPPISQAIANDGQTGAVEETVADGATGVGNTAGDTENQNSDETEGDASEDNVAADSTADGAEVKGAEQPSDAQPSDNENSDENAIAPVSAEDYKEVEGDVAHKFDRGGKYRLSGESWSDSQITITANTTIDLNGNMLYHRPGSVESFIVVQNNATLTIEDSGEDSGRVVDDPTPFTGEPGQFAGVEWTGPSGNKNKGTPKSLTYFETVSGPTENGLGTTETTTKHVLTGFGAIDAASENGSVQNVINVNEGCVLNLKGGMITTAASLKQYGQVIRASGTVNISGGYIAGGNCDNGGWGGGLCVTGANASLNMTGGIIAANKAASGGGVYADNKATLNLAGGIISGNATYGDRYNDVDNPNNGYGGGVFTKNADVAIGGSANITNNRVDSYITEKFNLGLLGGGGIASVDGGTLNMTGGSVTANYSNEAGGGIYAGFWGKAITFTMTGGTIAGNKSVNGEGGGLRIAGGNNSGTMATINAGENSKIYITNNKTMTGSTKDRGGDWGGGGIFIQEHGRLNILRSLITGNKAGGWSGGIGACPTGETIVSHSYGAAIYGNKDNVDQDGNPLGTYHYSAGGNNKNEDHDETNYVTPDFQKSGHKDFFLVRNKDDARSTIAVVLGKMLGGGSAGWHGTCDGNPVTIDPNGGAEAKYMFGLEAQPTDDAINKAQGAATTIISGNYSYTHGGGIMTNGDLVVGKVSDLNVYPSMELNATKVLKDEKGISQEGLGTHNYRFKLLRQDGTIEPSWKADGTFDMGDCIVAGEAAADKKTGEITFDSGKEYSSGRYVFYLVEEKPTSDKKESNTKFDKTIYKIAADIRLCKTDTLMNINIRHYEVSSVTVYKKDVKDKEFVELDSRSYSVDISQDSTKATVTIGNNEKPTFTNKIVPPFSWTPKATKVVEGGEMKEFTLQLAKDSKFEGIIGTAVTSGNENKQTHSFLDGNGKEIELTYSLSDIRNSSDPGDSTGGPSKTFKYYVREKNERSTYPHYEFDKSVYELTVVAKDDDAGITTNVTYTQIVDAEGNEIPENEREPKPYGEDTSARQSLPTFINTYSTSLPLSGMSGVTLTYLAGAAVLCAAAAWMHIRRKMNAKGGKRRE